MQVTQLAASAEASSIAITRPQHEEVVHDNTGAVRVAISLQGAAFAAGNRLRILIDGNPYGSDRHTLMFSLDKVERGTHALQVQLIDGRDSLVAESPTVNRPDITGEYQQAQETVVSEIHR